MRCPKCGSTDTKKVRTGEYFCNRCLSYFNDSDPWRKPLWKLFFILLILCLPIQLKAQYMQLPEDQLPAPRYATQYTDTLIDFGNGIAMRTEMLFPKTSGKPFPVVVLRIPYWQENLKIDIMPGLRQYAERGMGYVVQRCRGTGGSKGNYQPNIYEREDGLNLVRWLDAQPWINGIGLMGTSYMGLTCWIIADDLPAKVKCIHLHHYGIDRHLSAYNSGLFRQDILTAWAIDNAREPISRPYKNPDSPYYEQYKYMPQETMDVDMLGYEVPWYRDWITHTDYTDPYWHQGVWETLRNIPPKIKVPITVVAGHFDHHNEGTILGYTRLSPETKAKSRLIVGSWNHSFVTTPTVHEPKHDKDVNVDLDCFNYMYSLLVKGEEPKHEVLVYSIGQDEWLHFDEWPVETKTYEVYYLTAQHQQNGKPYILARDTKELKKKAILQFTYEPQNPVMSVGGETLFTSENIRGSRMQPDMGYRNDVISFISKPLTEDMTIDGKIKAVVYMSTDVDDTALTFKVSEVFPDGSAYNIRSGITTLAYRNNRLGARQKYTPGEIVELNFEALPILWQVKKGHRIRIDVTSSNFPEYSIHSNYAGIWSKQTRTRAAHQTLYVDPQYPSRIEIPVR